MWSGIINVAFFGETEKRTNEVKDMAMEQTHHCEYKHDALLLTRRQSFIPTDWRTDANRPEKEARDRVEKTQLQSFMLIFFQF